jgi:3-carboxy-cis,cis-muconate cycloisomerase
VSPADVGDLYWPGADRAGDLLSSNALLDAMLAVEAAWLDGLVAAGLAPAAAADDLAGLVGAADVAALAAGAEAGGNPVIGLVALLRERVATRRPEAARWLHRGLTSQDVLDTALVLALRDAVTAVRGELAAQVRRLADLADAHRATPMVARTLTQHAVPTTFGLKAAGWLTGVLDAGDDLAALAWPVQVGGAAGTLAAAVELAGDRADPVQSALDLASGVAGRLGLSPAAPWHTTRATLTRAGDALVGATDAWGHLANDVLVLSRPELGELSEGRGGGSSTMPHKANPVLATLVRRAALTTPQLAATLHLAAAEQVDERADGGWHVEAATVRTLGRRAVVAARQTTDLLAGLRVHPDRMGATLAAARDDVHAEQAGLAALTGRTAEGPYRGASDRLVDGVLDRARATLREKS